MWVVYLIQHNITLERYIGFTGKLKQRIRDHNFGKNKYTKREKGKWILIYAEAFNNKEDAKQREKMLKNHGNSKDALFKRLKYSLLEHKTGAGRS